MPIVDSHELLDAVIDMCWCDEDDHEHFTLINEHAEVALRNYLVFVYNACVQNFDNLTAFLQLKERKMNDVEDGQDHYRRLIFRVSKYLHAMEEIAQENETQISKSTKAIGEWHTMLIGLILKSDFEKDAASVVRAMFNSYVAKKDKESHFFKKHGTCGL